ncbi:MAG TPA: DUF5696 domain-containing protein [Kiritimatiellia bacterium]|nr:DUF5696 domain-containing protein [Kiritimatiellia bacterium]HPS06122.1 DUF5696 domain-containing protein [Kiritimatiellia bacterium]
MGEEPTLKAGHVRAAWAALTLALALALPAAAENGEAVKHALVRVTKVDGRITEKSQPLEEKADNVYRLKIPIKDITRDIDTIDIISADATAVKGEAGYFVVSTGLLGTFREDKGRLEERRNPMPIFGMKTPRGAFVGIVTGLKYEFKTVVDVTHGVYTIFPRFLIKEMVFDPYEDLVVDFHALEGNDANYSGMARAYRAYQLGRGEVTPLRERVKGNPQLAYTADTLFIRVKHGVKNNKNKVEHQTPTNEPPVAVSHTFDDFMRIMKDLKALGIEKAEMCSVGWNSGGFDGRFPTLFPADPAFGGEAKLREAIACAHRLGYQIVCHVCNTDFYTVSDRYDEDDIARRPDGTLHRHGILAGGRAFFPCFQRVNDGYVDEDYAGLAALGFKGTHHIDVTSCIVPYPCFNPMHPLNRQQTADHMNRIGLKARRTFGGFGSEGPCDHVANSLDFVLYVSAYPKWLGTPNPLIDRLIPLWQIAYHGIILSNPFYETIDYTFETKDKWAPSNELGSREKRTLKLVEFGGRPVFYFNSYKNLKPIKTAYDEYQPLKHLQYEFMESHDEIAKDVFLTTYSDGSETLCNYSSDAFVYRGTTVTPMGYALIKPSFLHRMFGIPGI